MLSLLKLLPDDRERVRVLRSLSTLRRSPDFERVIEFLTTAQQQIDVENRRAPAPHFQWNQGASQFLQEFIDLISDSETQARQLEERLNAQR